MGTDGFNKSINHCLTTMYLTSGMSFIKVYKVIDVKMKMKSVSFKFVYPLKLNMFL